MTSKQDDVMEQGAAWAAAFYHAFSQDYPRQTAQVANFMALLKAWYEGNPAPE